MGHVSDLGATRYFSDHKTGELVDLVECRFIEGQKCSNGIFEMKSLAKWMQHNSH